MRGAMDSMDNKDFHVPDELRNTRFLLRPIRATDAGLDYEAVMESRGFLRTWEQSGWPADDFTLSANREDLARLEQRHVTGESFTYTVMNLSESQCLGCVYIFPTSSRLFAKVGISALDGSQWTDYRLAVYFWIRKSCLVDGLDQQLLKALGPWLQYEWHSNHFLILTNELFAQQVSMIEGAGWRRQFELTNPNKPGKELAYAN